MVEPGAVGRMVIVILPLISPHELVELPAQVLVGTNDRRMTVPGGSWITCEVRPDQSLAPLPWMTAACV